MFHYAGWTRTCDSLFVVFALAFLVTRLVVFPGRYKMSCWNTMYTLHIALHTASNLGVTRFFFAGVIGGLQHCVSFYTNSFITKSSATFSVFWFPT